jgi:hypothetical protein
MIKQRKPNAAARIFQNEQPKHPSTLHNIEVSKRLGIQLPYRLSSNAHDARTNSELIKFPYTYGRTGADRSQWAIFGSKGQVVNTMETMDQEKVARATNEMNRRFAQSMGFIVNQAY